MGAAEDQGPAGTMGRAAEDLLLGSGEQLLILTN